MKECMTGIESETNDTFDWGIKGDSEVKSVVEIKREIDDGCMERRQ